MWQTWHRQGRRTNVKLFETITVIIIVHNEVKHKCKFRASCDNIFVRCARRKVLQAETSQTNRMPSQASPTSFFLSGLMCMLKREKCTTPLTENYYAAGNADAVWGQN